MFYGFIYDSHDHDVCCWYERLYMWHKSMRDSIPGSTFIHIAIVLFVAASSSSFYKLFVCELDETFEEFEKMKKAILNLFILLLGVQGIRLSCCQIASIIAWCRVDQIDDG